MSKFSISLKDAKAKHDGKAREEQAAFEKVMPDVEREQGETRGKSSLLDTLAHDPDEEEANFVPKSSKRHFTSNRLTVGGLGSLGLQPAIGFTHADSTGPYVTGPHGQSSGFAPSGPAGDQDLPDEEDTYANVIALASNLPPSIDIQRVEDMFSSHKDTLKVMKIVPHTSKSTGSGSRPSAQFKIYFDKGTTASDLTDFANKYNDKKYMGKGYYLHIDRFRSDSDFYRKPEPAPFGATERKRAKGIAPPTELGARGIAPPVEFGGRTGDRGGTGGWDRDRGAQDHSMEETETVVIVQVPQELAILKLIHMTIEDVIIGGVEFEAALMEDPQAQEDERFVFLYQHDHPWHRYYRWRLYQLLTGRGDSTRATIFEDQPDWVGPKTPFKDEFACELVDLSKPQEEEDDNDGDGGAYEIMGNYPSMNPYPRGFLSPLLRAFLMHNLYAMPVTETIKNEDVAFFSRFAIEATKGIDEVIDLLITNIFQPFGLFKASVGPGQGHGVSETGESSKRLSTATVNALYILSDVAWCTSKEGGHVSYRKYIEEQLIDRQVFEYLQTVPSRFSGKLNTGPFRNRVNEVLEKWKTEHLFEDRTLDHFDTAFNERTRQEEAEARAKKVMAKKERERERKQAEATKLRNDLGDLDGVRDMDSEQVGHDVDSDSAMSSGGEDQEEEADKEGETKEEEDEGDDDGQSDHVMTAESAVPAAEASDDAAPGEGGTRDHSGQTAAPTAMAGESAAARARRLRPRAEDMIGVDDE